MSVEAFSWALGVPIGGNAKVILLGLANHAHPDGSDAYPALDTLAVYAHCDRSTARRNVRKLVEAGWIKEVGHGPKGQIAYQLAMSSEPFSVGGGETPPMASAPPGGGSSASRGVAPVPPEPSLEPTTEPSTAGSARASTDGTVHRLPDDLPEYLHEPAITAARVLYRTAQRRGQKRPVLLEAVGRVVAQRPTKDHVDTAERIEFWLCWGKGQNKPCADVVQRFRDWLGDAPDIRLPNGSPLTAPTTTAGNVHPIRQANGKPSHDQLLAELRAANPRLQAEAARQLPAGP
jgi:hypothetical protein